MNSSKVSNQKINSQSSSPSCSISRGSTSSPFFLKPFLHLIHQDTVWPQHPTSTLIIYLPLSACSLCSSNFNLLPNLPASSGFAFAVTSVWNILPSDIHPFIPFTSFKSLLSVTSQTYPAGLAYTPTTTS